MGAMAQQTSIVHASSLANIIALADAPPPRPTPRLRGGKPLELYIARVPGSRDIFLTTLKPRDKVVTAQDIENCLYYCHLESENDDLFRHEEDYFGESANDGESHDSDVAPSPISQPEPISPTSQVRAPSLPPLPERTLEYGKPADIHAPLLPPRPEDLTPKAIKRKPINGSHERIEAATSSSPATVPILPPRPISGAYDSDRPTLHMPARPLGPRPLSDRRQSENVDLAAVPLKTNGSVDAVQLQNPPSLPRRPVSMLPASSHLTGQRQSASADGYSTRANGQRPPQSPFAQSRAFGKENVGSSHSNDPYHQYSKRSSQPPPVPAHSFDNLPWTDASPQPGSLSPRSTTSSLRRSNSLVSNIPAGFDHTKTSPHSGFNVTLIRRNPATSTQSNVGKITVPATNSHYRPASKVLLQIFNPGYNHFRSAPENGQPLTTSSLVRCLSEDDDCTFSTDLRLATRRRSIKSPSTPYFGDVPVNQLISVSPSQPYSFLGPWNRVCEFGTGVRGKSLKCRHMLGTGLRMRGYGTDEDGTSGRLNAQKEHMSVVELSELRFNTPSSGLFAKSKQQDRRPRTGSAVAGFGMGSSTSHTGLHAIHRKSVSVFSSHSNAHEQAHRHIQPPALPPRNPLVQHQQFSMPRHSHDSVTAVASPSTLDTASHFEAPYQDQDLDLDIEPMDLSLGQERAGGGFKGNKAKLGKLVVEPEGLEMLDLLVAANMGIWWSIR